jgi:hypothetical protein
MKEPTIKQYFGSLPDAGGLPFLSEVIEDYTTLAQLFQERTLTDKKTLFSLSSFMVDFYPGLALEYFVEITNTPSVYCLRPLILYARQGIDRSSFLAMHLDKFQKQTEEEAAVAVQTLEDVRRLTSFVSIADYIALLPSQPKPHLNGFL